MFSSIGVDEFYQKFKKESLTIIDVRETDEFEREHIPSARTLPLSELEQRIDQLNKDEKLKEEKKSLQYMQEIKS